LKIRRRRGAAGTPSARRRLADRAQLVDRQHRAAAWPDRVLGLEQVDDLDVVVAVGREQLAREVGGSCCHVPAVFVAGTRSVRDAASTADRHHLRRGDVRTLGSRDEVTVPDTCRRIPIWLAMVPVGDVEGRLVAGELGRALLQPVDGRVVAVPVVADSALGTWRATSPRSAA
jgi:hypothetical protein